MSNCFSSVKGSNKAPVKDIKRSKKMPRYFNKVLFGKHFISLSPAHRAVSSGFSHDMWWLWEHSIQTAVFHTPNLKFWSLQSPKKVVHFIHQPRKETVQDWFWVLRLPGLPLCLELQFSCNHKEVVINFFLFKRAWVCMYQCMCVWERVGTTDG